MHHCQDRLWLSKFWLAQVIIEKAYESVQKDHVKDALSLFVDFMAIFVSVLPSSCVPWKFWLMQMYKASDNSNAASCVSMQY